MKNKAIIAICLVAALAAAVSAVGAPIDVASKIWSKYLGPNGSMYHDKPVLQTAVSGELPKAFYWEVFHSIGLDDGDFSSNFGDEIDLTVGKTFELSESLTLDASVAYWDTVDLLSSKPADVAVASTKLSLATGESSSVSLCFDRYVSTDTSIYASGYKVGLYASFEQEVRTGLTLSLEPSVSYDSGAYGYQKAWVAALDASLAWKLDDRVSIVLPAMSMTRMLSTVADRRKTEVVWGGGLSIAF